jgi:hypothetical protein
LSNSECITKSLLVILFLSGHIYTLLAWNASSTMMFSYVFFYSSCLCSVLAHSVYFWLISFPYVPVGDPENIINFFCNQIEYYDILYTNSAYSSKATSYIMVRTKEWFVNIVYYYRFALFISSWRLWASFWKIWQILRKLTIIMVHFCEVVNGFYQGTVSHEVQRSHMSARSISQNLFN